MREIMQNQESCFMRAASGSHIRFQKIKAFPVVRKFERCLYNIDAYVCNVNKVEIERIIVLMRESAF